MIRSNTPTSIALSWVIAKAFILTVPSALYASQHWAFQPIGHPQPPEIQDSNWAQSPVDNFVLAKLQAHGIQPAPPADRATLLRRAYYDLIGLPPTYDEIQQFLADRSPDAFQKQIDRLLAQKEYGERWGRHWLDVARYADTKGPLDGGPTTYAFAYTYRDWVINAFNEDMRFDEFIKYQLAADLIPTNQDQPKSLAALGFITVGHRYYDRVHEIMDDRIDVVGRGLLGLTIACARCHDHKYDPIPTADYYSLYGVFRSVVEPYNYEKPLLETTAPSHSMETMEFRERYDELKKKLSDYRRDRHETIMHEMRAYAGDYLEFVAWENPKHRSKSQFLRKTERILLRAGSLHGEGAAIKWRRYIETKDAWDPVFGLWHRLADLPREGFATGAAPLIHQATDLNRLVRERLIQGAPQNFEEAGHAIGRLLEGIYEEWKSLKAEDPQSSGFNDIAKEQLRAVLFGDPSPCVLTERESRTCYHILESDELYRRERAFEGHLVRFHEHTASRGMAVFDDQKPYNPHVFVRGQPDRRGKPVERGFLELLAPVTDRRPFETGSGRLAIANAIVHPENPLTARVWVNRIWKWHFGRGLVTTPSDFGTRSDPPSHPALLDYLARQLIESGWSIKRLHRLMMNSSVYQQRSRNDAALLVDPENRWRARMNRPRLSFEQFRDKLLKVSSRLDSSSDGFPEQDFESPRRSVYLLVNRNRLDSLASILDFPDPGLSSPGRSVSIMPQQSLYLMNHPFIATLARRLAAKVETAPHPPQERQVTELYRTILSRDAEPQELANAIEFINREKIAATKTTYPEPPPKIWHYGYGKFDPDRGHVRSFHELPHWTGRSWQGGDRYPDDELGFLRLSSEQGHPGKDTERAVIRRWVAPDHGTFLIEGSVAHEIDEDDNKTEEEPVDGIRASIVLNGTRLIHQKVVTNDQAEFEVSGLKLQRGDTIDFVVDCRSNRDGDAFEWAPILIQVEDDPAGDERVELATYNAASDFAGPQDPFQPLRPLAKLAHALLQTNEFMFID